MTTAPKPPIPPGWQPQVRWRGVYIFKIGTAHWAQWTQRTKNEKGESEERNRWEPWPACELEFTTDIRKTIKQHLADLTGLTL